MTTETLEQTAERIVRQEVRLCLSYLVSTLAAGISIDAPGLHKVSEQTRSLLELTEQAAELAAPVDDYEEAAIQEGWKEQPREPDGQHIFKDTTDGQTWCAADWRTLCHDLDIKPYQRDVFEHWAVSDWLADKLIERGEKVDKDFAGLCVWARTTSGQMISMDSVIEAIAREIHTPATAEQGAE